MRIHAFRNLSLAAAGESVDAQGDRGREGLCKGGFRENCALSWLTAQIDNRRIPMRLSKRLTPILLTAALPVFVAGGVQAHTAQAPVAKDASVIETDAPPVPLLWKVSDADNAVYLLGSFHLLKPTDYPLSPEVDAAFADAERLVFEMSPEEMASPTLALEMQKAAIRDDGRSLQDDLGPKVWGRLEAYANKNGLPTAMLSSFEPWFVGLMISLTEMQKHGLDSKLGLDTHFAAQAKQAGKPTAGFETGQQQISFLDTMSRDEQIQMVDEALAESAEGKAAVDKLHAAWRAGDEKTMWEEMAGDLKRQYPKLYQHINVDRNDAWVPQIENRLASGTDDSLVVVGTLHLLGGDGVVEKLRAKGYQVERICSSCVASAGKKATR